MELKEQQAGEEQEELIYPMYVDSSLPYDFAGRERLESYTTKMRQGRRKEREGWNVCQVTDRLARGSKVLTLLPASPGLSRPVTGDLDCILLSLSSRRI